MCAEHITCYVDSADYKTPGKGQYRRRHHVFRFAYFTLIIKISRLLSPYINFALLMRRICVQIRVHTVALPRGITGLMHDLARGWVGENGLRFAEEW